MKLKQIYTLISIFLFTFNGISQTKNDGYEKYSAYDLDYINDNGFKDLRLRKKGIKPCLFIITSLLTTTQMGLRLIQILVFQINIELPNV